MYIVTTTAATTLAAITTTTTTTTTKAKITTTILPQLEKEKMIKRYFLPGTNQTVVIIKLFTVLNPAQVAFLTAMLLQGGKASMIHWI